MNQKDKLENFSLTETETSTTPSSEELEVRWHLENARQAVRLETKREMNGEALRNELLKLRHKKKCP